MEKSKSGIEKQLKRKLQKKKTSKYCLRLYVAGLSPSSQRAIDNIKKLCEEHLQGRYELAIQDIYQNPIQVKNAQILAAPTLIQELPEPQRRFVGDMSNAEKLLLGLDLRAKE